MFTEDDLIHACTRRQAIEDGVLIDVTETAREAGIVFPMAVTAAVWSEFVAVPAGVVGQDEAGRLWDIVWLTRHAIRSAPAGADTVPVKLYVRNDNRRPRLVNLKAVCGPDDNGAPCITLMLPGED